MRYAAMTRRLFIAAGIFHPEPGGPSTYLYEILPELQARGWQVRLLTYSSGASDGYGYSVTRIPRRAFPIRVMHYALAARAWLRWADVVYIHTLELPLIGGRAARVMKIVGDQAWERAIRKGWIPPDEDIDVFQTRRYGPRVTAQQEIRARQVRAVDGVIVPSQYLKRMVMGWGIAEAKIRVIYNALPPVSSDPGRRGLSPLFNPSLSQLAARAVLGIGDEPLLFTAARLVRWKGIDHLLTALARVPEVRLLVAGDGPVRAELEQQAERLGGRVTFLGPIPREKVQLYMKAADYLVLYSGYEGLSHTLLESLREGTPVIVSDKGGNPEVVQHGVNGLLVPYVDVEALAAALVEAFQPGKRESLAANTHVGMERFDFARMVEQTANALGEYVR